jgi:hypothetical protein
VGSLGLVAGNLRLSTEELVLVRRLSVLVSGSPELVLELVHRHGREDSGLMHDGCLVHLRLLANREATVSSV